MRRANTNEHRLDTLTIARRVHGLVNPTPVNPTHVRARVDPSIPIYAAHTHVPHVLRVFLTTEHHHTVDYVVEVTEYEADPQKTEGYIARAFRGCLALGILTPKNEPRRAYYDDPKL